MKKHDLGRNKKVLEGAGISPGFAFGKAFVYKDLLTRKMYYYSIEREEARREIARIKEVFARVLKDIKKMEKNVKEELGREQSAIFKVHAEILKDVTLLREIEKEIKSGLVNAEYAVRKVLRKWAERFRSSETEKIRSRADDIEDLARRVLCHFMRCDMNVLENIPARSVIVARRLLPSDTARLKRKNVEGIVVEDGSKFSHAAIIATASGIPAVAGVNKILEKIKPGDRLIVDGYEGVVIKDPGREEVKEYKRKAGSAKKAEARLIAGSKKKARIRGGGTVKVYANAASREDVKTASSRGFDGIGLLRIEQIYMSTRILPDEEYLKKKLAVIIAGAGKKVITLRLLDAGADKGLPYIDIEDEANPDLGLRGVRLLLKYKNLLKTQLKVAMILSVTRKIRILVPMVTFHGEIEEVREAAEECAAELANERGIKVKLPGIGAMIETPAAVENIEKISGVSDFISVGTNDLIQYSVAAGRDNPSVAEYYEYGAGLAVKYIGRIVKCAVKHNIECGVCGEIAGDIRWTKPLIKAGVRVLSVSPYLIPEIKKKISNI